MALQVLVLFVVLDYVTGPCGGVIITVDGVDILEGGGTIPENAAGWFVPAADGGLSVVTACAAPIMLDFATSLKIRTKTGISGGNSARIYWVYSKE